VDLAFCTTVMESVRKRPAQPAVQAQVMNMPLARVRRCILVMQEAVSQVHFLNVNEHHARISPWEALTFTPVPTNSIRTPVVLAVLPATVALPPSSRVRATEASREPCRLVWAILARTTCPTARAGQLLVTDLPQGKAVMFRANWVFLGAPRT